MNKLSCWNLLAEVISFLVHRAKSTQPWDVHSPLCSIDGAPARKQHKMRLTILTDRLIASGTWSPPSHHSIHPWPNLKRWILLPKDMHRIVLTKRHWGAFHSRWPIVIWWFLLRHWPDRCRPVRWRNSWHQVFCSTSLTGPHGTSINLGRKTRFDWKWLSPMPRLQSSKAHVPFPFSGSTGLMPWNTGVVWLISLPLDLLSGQCIVCCWKCRCCTWFYEINYYLLLWLYINY